MPIKEFECQACRHRFEEILGIHEPNPTACPKCKSADLKQLLSTFRIAGLSKKSGDTAAEGNEPLDAAGGEFGGSPYEGMDDGIDEGMGDDIGEGMSDGGAEEADASEGPAGNDNKLEEV